MKGCHSKQTAPQCNAAARKGEEHVQKDANALTGTKTHTHRNTYTNMLTTVLKHAHIIHKNLQQNAH